MIIAMHALKQNHHVS